MASIGKDGNGRKRILFVDRDGSRKTIRLGKATEKMALAVKLKIEALVSAKFTGGTVDDEVSRWIAGLGDDLHGKLASCGLVTARAATVSATLGTLLDWYTQSRTDIKPGTVLVHQQAKQSLLGYFGPDKPLREIHEGDAELWRLSMVEQGLADATIRKRSGNAKQFLAFAIRQRLVSTNPFIELKSSARGNDKRLYFLSRGDAQKVLDGCPDSQWRLLFALARFGGLRCPSEILALRWQDVNWERSRMLVRSCKTEHNPGGESRLVPIFPELRPHLMQAFEGAESGTEYCITRYRRAGCNLRTQLHRIIRKAGLKPWPRTFQNLRATRETELAESFPLHVVTEWIGNSQIVAQKHYLQVTDEHFARAAQNPAQYRAELGSNRRNVAPQETPENGVLQGVTAGCDAVPEFLLAPKGLEQTIRVCRSTDSTCSQVPRCQL